MATVTRTPHTDDATPGARHARHVPSTFTTAPLCTRSLLAKSLTPTLHASGCRNFDRLRLPLLFCGGTFELPP